MRLWKTCLSILFAAILAIQSVCLGWSIVERNEKAIIIYALQAVFAFYNFCIALLSVRQTNPYHTHSIWHLFGLTSWATTLLVTAAILPSSPIPSTSMVLLFGTPIELWYTALALYSISCIIVLTIPTGPALHFPSDRIYSEKIIQMTTSKYEDNVCGVTGEYIRSCDEVKQDLILS